MTLRAAIGALPPAAQHRLRARAASGMLTERERDILVAASRDADARPLAYARLWHRDPPRTSQLGAVGEVLAWGVRLAAILGGNRSGKSDAGAQVGAAFVLGREHRDVRDWAAGNGIPLEAIPVAGRVCSLALTSADSTRYVRPRWASYLGPSAEWRNREGNGDAYARAGAGTVVFKSADQGRRAMQGDAYDLVVCDEEPDVPGVVDELRMRLVDRRGRMLLTMTPLRGRTALIASLLSEPGAVVRWLHGTDNPHVPEDELRRLLAQYGPHERAARERGEITAMEGRVYPAWSRAVHVMESDPPPDWPRYIAVDWGTTVPTAMLYAAEDLATDTAHVLDEVYETQLTITQRADRIRSLEARHGTARVRWVDPEDASTNRTITVEHGILLTSARKDVRHGINVVGSRMAPDALGRPHLIVHPRCVHLCDELDGYVWDSVERERPSKVNDHACDALRYLLVGMDRSEERRLLESLAASGV